MSGASIAHTVVPDAASHTAAADAQLSGIYTSTTEVTAAPALQAIGTTAPSVEKPNTTAAPLSQPSPLGIPIPVSGSATELSSAASAAVNAPPIPTTIAANSSPNSNERNTRSTTSGNSSKPTPLSLAPSSTTAPSVSPSRLQSQSASSVVPPPSRFLRSPKGFQTHRQNTLSESIPRQTILKALASTKSRGPLSAGLEPGSALSANKMDSLTINTPGSGMTDGSLKHPLQSPCFFHERFDDVINIDKVLEEVKAASEYTSHHRLLQTATGVREVARQLGRKPIKMHVKSVMIVTKARDNTLVTLTREVAHWLMKTPRYGSDLGVNVYVDEKLQKSKRFDSEGLIKSEPRFASMLKYWTPDLCWTSPEKFDLVLTLGGDGTVLFTSWLFQRVVPLILSFSLGSLGFMTNFPFDMYKEHLDKVLTEGMRVNMRMRFTCTVYRDSKGQMEEAEQFEVLNG